MKKIILNHKSYLLFEEEKEYKNELNKLNVKNYEIILFPPVLYLTMFNNCKYPIGAQNFFSKKEGSFTGEINLDSLKDIGVTYTLIGNYDRKLFLNESFEESKEKLFKSLNSKFNTLLCVGENRKSIRPFEYMKREINNYLMAIEKNNLKYLSIVYEPTWAMGDGKIIDINKISKVIDRIKIYIKNKYNVNVEVYYGGLVNTTNIKDIMNICDGVVLGKQSINIKEIKKLLGELND